MTCVAALPNLPVVEAQSGNVTEVCANADGSSTSPIRSLNRLAAPPLAGRFFGPGTTVVVPFAAEEKALFPTLTLTSTRRK